MNTDFRPTDRNFRGDSPRSDRSQDNTLPFRRVFVGNLSFKTTWQTLKDHMRKAGNVLHVDVFSDQKRGGSKGCGLVEFANERDAQDAIKMLNGSYLEGRAIFVREDDKDLSKFDWGKREEDRDRRGGRGRDDSLDRGRRTFDPDYRRFDQGPRGRSRSRSRSRSRDNCGKCLSPDKVNYRIVIKNLPLETKMHQVTEHFKDYGNIVNVKLENDPVNKTVKNAIIEFDDQKDAEKAINSMTNSTIGGMNLVVTKGFN